MSWSIRIVGTKKGVRKHVSEAKAYGTDDSQIEAAKAFIAAEIDSYPETVQGVDVEACGHHDAHSRNLSIKVTPIHVLALDDDAIPAKQEG